MYGIEFTPRCKGGWHTVAHPESEVCPDLELPCPNCKKDTSQIRSDFKDNKNPQSAQIKFDPTQLGVVLDGLITQAHKSIERWDDSDGYYTLQYN